jgi:hypothetical protein
MKKYLLLLFVFASIIITACKKGSDSESVNYGTKLNTWTFTEGSNVFNGLLLFESASLNTFLQNNNSYNFTMTGPEIKTGYFFSIFLSLLDVNFTTKTYQSGTAGNDYMNAFYFTETNASLDDIYKSSNLDPGPIMTFNITAYDAAKDIVTITFSGQAQLLNGSYVNITNGKVTCNIER